jgi:6-pyruvoyl-tetrahydropterin synthase
MDVLAHPPNSSFLIPPLLRSTCDVEFASDSLNEETNWVIDIGKASEILAEVLAKYNFKNLDEVFHNGELTTTEFMARQIHVDVRERLLAECRDFQGEVCVKLRESHKAWASYRGKV